MALITQKRSNGIIFAIASGYIVDISSGKTVYGKPYTKMTIVYGKESEPKENGDVSYKDLRIHLEAYNSLADYCRNLEFGDRIVVLGTIREGKYVSKYTQKEATWISITCDSVIVQEAKYSKKTDRKKRAYSEEEEAEADDVYIADEFDEENPGNTKLRTNVRPHRQRKPRKQKGKSGNREPSIEEGAAGPGTEDDFADDDENPGGYKF